ncbi:MAG: ABC transporter transmembrane domain-containing protein [Rhizobiaceae bacterium]
MLNDEEHAAILSKFSIETKTMGELLFNEGDAGDCLFIILSGKVRAFHKGSDGKPITLGVLSSGDVFGEMALLGELSRGASVRVSEDAVLAVLDKQDFDGLLGKNAELTNLFSQISKERGLFNVVRNSAIGSKLPAKVLREIIPKFEKVFFEDQELVVGEGDSADCMYVVLEGRFLVSKEIAGEVVELDRLGSGDILGERALVMRERRAATVTALGKAACLRLSADQFEKSFATRIEVVTELKKHITKYRNVTEPMPVDGAPARQFEEVVADETLEAESNKQRKFRQRLRLRYPFIEQHLESDCGAACLGMIGRWYGERYALSNMRDLANVDDRGASMMGLSRAAEHLGFSTRAMRLDRHALASIQTPAILFWEGYHYVVLWKLTKRSAVIGDPARGTLSVSMAEFEKQWSGYALALTPGEKISIGTERSMISRFIPMVQPYIGMLFEVSLTAIIIAILGLAMPVFTQTIMDSVLPNADLEFLNVILVGMALVTFFTAVGGGIRQLLLLHVGQRLGLRLSNELFKRLLLLPVPYFRRRRLSDIMARFGDNSAVEDLLTDGAVGTLIDAIMVSVYFGLMFYYSSTLAGIAALYFVASTVLVVCFSPSLKRNNQLMFEKGAATQGKLIEALTNIETIKSSGSELSVRWEFENLIVDESKQEMKAGILGLGLNTIATFLQLGLTVAILWLGARQVVAGDLTLGELVAFQSLVMMSVGPVSSLVGLYQEIQDALLSLNRLSDIYDAEPEETGVHTTMPQVSGNIVFDKVSFGYSPNEPPVIDNLTLDISAGETVALIGRSGSGKTTLISLVQRFYQPDGGRVMVDGIDIAGVAAASLRTQIGVVPQDPQLFTATIRENIAYGYPEATMSQIVESAKLANAHDFIQKFPLGYETVVGEIGVRLSGGQRQRLAIARALLPDPPIILFDEATSALDTESERAIQRNLDAIMKERTAVVIAHRLSTIQNADRIIVLDGGRAVEQGTFDALMGKQGLFYYLVRQQMGS